MILLASSSSNVSASGGNRPTNSATARSGEPTCACDFEAAIFDLDGVITQTAAVHRAAWQQTFDEFLRAYALRRHEAFVPFTTEDYLAYVDGRPRYQGVAAFLQARGIVLPFGSPDDGPDAETVCGIGNRKNLHFNRRVETDGVAVFASSLVLLHALRAQGVHIGLATSSRNAALVLERTGLTGLFATVVDGAVSEKRGLKGKPAPDIFVAAAGDLGVPCGRAIVVEDAVAGVQAGAQGGFALVIGIARENNLEALRASGADLVVGDLADTSIEEISRLVRARKARS